MLRLPFITILVFISSAAILYSQEKSVVIEGFIKDINTYNNIADVEILIGGKLIGYSSDKGYFKIKIPHGRSILRAHRIDYEKQELILEIDSTVSEKKINIFLKPEPIDIEKVTITGERYSEKLIHKTYELQQGDLRRIPSFVESDIMRAIQTLPGVAIASDMGAQFYLRGGNFDETMLAVDGAPLYNPYHVGGLFAMFNPDIVREVKLYPSNYPVYYGGYISGILNMQTKDGNNENYTGSASLGLLSSKAYVEGPLGSGSIVLSGRRTYFDILGLINKNLKFPYYFYDIYGKYTLPFDANNLLRISALYTKDNFELYSDSKYDEFQADKNEDSNWGNILLKAGYTHFYKHSSIDFDVYYSRSYLNADAKVIKDEDSFDRPEFLFVDNTISEYAITLEYNYENYGHNFRTGIKFKKLQTSYNWNIGKNEFEQYLNKRTLENIFYDFAENPYSSNDETNNMSFYALDEVQLSKQLSAQAGIRFSYLTDSEMFLTSPFLSTKFSINNNIQLSLSYGKYYQYFHTKRESIDISPVVPFSIYFISKSRAVLPASDHYSVSLNWSNLPYDLIFDIELYYKKRKNIPSTFENEGIIKYLNGYAGGMDIILRKDNGPINGWINYSYSRSVKIDGNSKFYSNYDRTHNAKLLVNFDLSETWTLSAYWMFTSGLPYTILQGKYIDDGFEWKLVYGNKNAARFYSSQRLDLGITGNVIWSGYLFHPYLQILNVYNSSNPVQYNPSPNSLNGREAERGSLVIPTIGITMEF